MIYDIPEHADLGFDVSPLAGSFEVIRERVVKFLAHADNTVCHAFNFLLPVHITLTLDDNYAILVSTYHWP